MSWGKMKASTGGGSEKVSPGNHPAVLVAIIEMGHHWQDGMNGKKGYWAKRAYFVWELTQEKKSGSELNHTIATDLTWSITGERAKLRKFIESRLGRKLAAGEEYDVLSELGKACMVNVSHNAKGYPRVEGVAPLPKGFPAIEPKYPLTTIQFEEIRNGAQVPDWIPYHYGKPIDEVIKTASKEYGAKSPEENGIDKGPIPF